MQGSHANPWGLGNGAGDWERFQIYIPDSGGVTNSMCNYPGAAYIFNPSQARWIECGNNGDCYPSEHDNGDYQQCESAWYFFYAESSEEEFKKPDY